MDIRQIDHIIIVAYTKEGKMLQYDKKAENVFQDATRWLENLSH